MLIFKMKLINTNAGPGARPLMERIVELDYDGPEDRPAVANLMTQAFQEFKRLVSQLLRVGPV